jgi:hypothetical protein
MEMGRNVTPARPIDLRSRNMAALALASAMERMREGSVQPAAASTYDSSQMDQRLGSMRKLEALRANLEPLFAAIPPDAEGFDLGFVTESKPRLFVDMLSHVSVDPESGAFRFVQETRNGRRLLLETLDEDVLMSRITDHVAERLVAREYALEAGQPEPTAMMTSNAAAAFEDGVAAAQAIKARKLPLAGPVSVASAAGAILAPSNAEEGASSGLQSSVEQAVSAETPASAVATKGGIRGVTFEDQRQSRRGWIWPILAFLVGIAAAIAAGYLFIAKEIPP